MTQYEIRGANRTSYFLAFPHWEEREAKRAYEKDYRNAPVTDLRHGATLVLHTFETPTEADKARLLWLEENRNSHIDFDAWTCIFNSSGPINDAIDRYRKAPQPSVRVIATPEGSV